MGRATTGQAPWPMAAARTLRTSSMHGGCPAGRPLVQEFVQLDAAMVAGDTLYLAEHQRVLAGESIGGLLLKVSRIR